MSTYYRPTEKIKLSEYKKIKGLKVKPYKKGINEYGNLFQANGSTLHYAINNQKEVIDLMRYGGNNADDILELVSAKLDVAFISEHENGYQGLADEDTDVVTIQIK